MVSYPVTFTISINLQAIAIERPNQFDFGGCDVLCARCGPASVIY